MSIGKSDESLPSNSRFEQSEQTNEEVETSSEPLFSSIYDEGGLSSKNSLGDGDQVSYLTWFGLCLASKKHFEKFHEFSSVYRIELKHCPANYALLPLSNKNTFF